MKAQWASSEGRSVLAESLCHQKKLVFKISFQFLLLLCLAMVLCYSLSSSQSWWTGCPLRDNLQLKAKVTNNSQTPQPLTAHPAGLQYHEAYPRNYRFVMDNADICRNSTPFLVLMVPVAPDNVEARRVIRKTWGKDRAVRGEAVLTLFVLGRSRDADVEKLEKESAQHGDLIQSDFADTYLNLTIKTMVIMDWLATRCPAAAYAMKVDSDMFLNVDNLVIMLKKPGIPRANYLTGYMMRNILVLRDKSSKWYVSEEMYPDSRYPTYVLGMGYVFSNDLPEKYVQVSKWVKPFNIEDAYIGMCMKKLGLVPTPPPVPSQFRTYNQKYDRCEFSKVITYILSSSQHLLQYWLDLKRPEPPC